jgi:cytoskeletal protein CcmA (bactofilin family)
MKLTRVANEEAGSLNTTVILKGIRVVGDVRGSHNLHLNGEFEGSIELSALLLVGKTGRLKGEVKAENVIIEGDVEAKISAKEKVEVRDSGKYVGDILAPSILVSERAFFQGNVEMVRESQSVVHRDFTANRPEPFEDESPSDTTD